MSTASYSFGNFILLLVLSIISSAEGSNASGNALHLIGTATERPKGCTININRQLRSNSRMILHPDSSSTDGYRFFLPSTARQLLTFLNGQEVVFACPNGVYEKAQCNSVSGCTLHPSDVSADSPLILQHRYRNGISPFRMPSDPGSESLTFSSGDAVRLACPDADNNLLVIPNSPLMVYEVVAFCITDSTFSISGAAYNFRAIRCKLTPQSTIKEEGSCDIGIGKKYNIGFKFKRKFLGIIELCYDTAKQSTLNAIHILSKSVGYHDFNLQINSHFPSSGFGTENTRTPDDFYSCKTQLKTLERLLGSPTQAKKYINCNHKSNMYLDNCHLAPKEDFLFEYQKKAANFYINTAPQWKAISTGNWNILQQRIRRYASIRKVDLTVVTGTMNISTLQDDSGTERDLYLSKDMRNKPTVPVPAMFWKMVLDRPRNAGIVFVCVNNPYHYDIHTRDYVICTDICDSTTSWLDGLNRLDIRQGYVYCCTVDQFRSKSNIKPFPFIARHILR